MTPNNNKRRLPKKLVAVEGQNQLRNIITLLTVIFGIGTLGIAVWQYLEIRAQSKELQRASADVSTHTNRIIDDIRTFEDTMKNQPETSVRNAEEVSHPSDKDPKRDHKVLSIHDEAPDEEEVITAQTQDDILLEIYRASESEEKKLPASTTQPPLKKGPPAQEKHQKDATDNPRCQEKEQLQSTKESPPKQPNKCPANSLYLILETYEVPTLNQQILASLEMPITFAVVPLDEKLTAHMEVIQALKEPYILDLPMTPKNHAFDPGPGSLNPRMNDKALKELIHKNLNMIAGYQGAKNRMGSLFTAHKEKMALLMHILKQKNILFIDALTGKSIGAAVAKEQNLPYAARDILINANDSEAVVHDKLNHANKLSQKNSRVIIIMPATTDLIHKLHSWLKANPEAKKLFAPITCIHKALSE